MSFDIAQLNTEQQLPIANALDAVDKAVAQHSTVVIQAPPGTGKTTLIPPHIHNLLGGKILVTAPRRVAVRAAARRLATLSGTQVGDKIGYSVRGDSQPGSHIEFLTPGVLIRRLLNDPELEGVHAVILDEVHERQLDTDCVMGMLYELTQLRDNLHIIAMSATVDATRFATLLNAPVISQEAPSHPTTITYQPLAGRSSQNQEFIHEFTQLIATHSAQHDASTLVFLPSIRLVEHCCAQLSTLTDLPVYPLHGQQTPQIQDEALNTTTRRIVVATPLAESSLTVPGVRLVIDSGLVRVPKRDAHRGMNGLVTQSCSQSAAIQRAGRAGREGPGTVIRCYSQSDYQRFKAHTEAEILSADLTQFCLFLACWHTSIDEFPLLDPAPHASWNAARTTLQQLGAITDEGTVTDHGRTLASVPADPRFATALLRAGTQAAETIACISDNPRGIITELIADKRGTHRFRREVHRLERLAPKKNTPLSVGEIIGLALPHLIARNEGTEFLLAQGTRATLAKDCRLGQSPWIACAELTLSTSGPVILAADELTEEQALRLLPRTETLHTTVSPQGKVTGIRRVQAGAIVLNETPAELSVAEATEALINAGGHQFLHWGEEELQLKARINLIARRFGAPWVDVDTLDAAQWLRPELEALATGTKARALSLHNALQRILPWPEATRLNDYAPSHFHAPSGRSVAINYLGERPTVTIKVQECFGLSHSPVILDQPLLFELLSPAGRPLAITDDLARFWDGSYAQVRAEMRGRYPKHPWPEDPRTAEATALTTRALNAHRSRS
ncbi:MAG: ATP-dependent helicase HrpB [Corynebacterium sp.]|uniref:ATP-dependent helicase HrpB n=1 Tax=Corynebacterium sp. TaxID=1720 RepID=UPI0026DC8CC3|nr:ATP-dependent helicase HrpB [Corynebacterium sp.]MDO4761969.1 ATP-dependent helicase HrpB [Corynebacterium sp.]